MNRIDGPFDRDPNIRAAILHFDDFLWILNRPALQAGRLEGEIGSLELRDVRAYRLRAPLASDSFILESLAVSWAVELSHSEYLQTSREQDPQRTPAALSSHLHFVIADGSDYLLDVVARSATTRTHGVLSALDMQRLFLGEIADHAR